MKKLICILVSFVMLLSLCTPVAYADETPEAPEESTTFYAPTVRQMIEVNLELRNTDEQFFHQLTEAYLADPLLLIQIIADLPGEDILYLAKAIAYDLQKRGKVDEAVIPAGCDSPELSAIAKLILAQVRNPENGHIEALYDAELLEELSTIRTASTIVPQIGLLTLSDTVSSLSETVTLTFSIFSYSSFTTATTYTYKVFRTDGTTETQVTAGIARIAAGTLSYPVAVSFANSAMGYYRYYVKVYGNIDTLLKTSATSNPLATTDKWLITVELTDEREQLGTITLYDASGTQICSDICLGKSADDLPMNQINGHTPMGVYKARIDAHLGENIKYGDNLVVKMYQYAGYANENCGHRQGLWIHGGRAGYNADVNDPSYPLYHTEGCVRITDAFHDEMISEIKLLDDPTEAQMADIDYRPGLVVITQNGEIN